MKVRRYLRGSGRVLAFVFVASVIWLLFDMAALRLSINDVNSQILKERVVKERELLKKQSRATQPTKRGFKHPLQGVRLAVSPAGKGVDPVEKLAEVSRQRGRQQGQMFGDKERTSLQPRGHYFTRTSHPTYLLSERGEGTNLKSIAPKQDITVENTVNLFDVNGIRREKRLEIDVLKKQRLPVVFNVTKTIQDDKEPSLTLAKKESPESENGRSTPVKTDAKAKERSKDGPKSGRKDGRLEPLETHPAQTASKPPNKDVNMIRANMKAEEKHATTAVKRDLASAQETGNPTVRTGPGPKPNSKKAGVHKVLYLDATLVPRDAKAVGQFGQAVHVSSQEDAQVRKSWDEGFFNVYLSNQIPVDRAIPDTRPET